MNMVALPTEVSVACGSAPLLTRVLPPGEYVIGTAPDADIPITADGVAPRHALLSLGFNEWLVEDLGSTGGTFVNGEAITAPRIVFPSQKIRLGAAIISVRRLKTPAEPGEMLAPQTETVRQLLPDEILGNGKYEIGPMAGRGGMGVILDAHELATQRNVAMKLMIDCTRPADIGRFVQEAQITAQLEHPNIVPVHELGVNELDQPFYTMKFVRGVSLGKVLSLLALDDPANAKKYPLSALLTIFQKICDAVAFAHSKGIIHRDLKPENIMLGEYGEALVMDWGLAKVMGKAEDHGAAPGPVHAASGAHDTSGFRRSSHEYPTVIGTVMGTLQYMPPEQANGEIAQLDARADIYSLGAILYHMLTLQPPFAGEKGEILESVRTGTIVRPADVLGLKRLPHSPGGRVPESLAAVAMKALARDPRDRYATVPDLQLEITAYQNGFATGAEKAGVWKRAALFLRRNRTLSTAAALLLLAGTAFTFKVVQERDRARAAKRVADEQRDVAEAHLYDSHMLQAGQHLAEGRPESARGLLQRHRREPGGRDLRGWEWFYLIGQLNQDRIRVQAHPGGVLSIAISADAARLATGGADGEIAVWGTRGFVPYFRIRAHAGAVAAVAWHGAGNLIASGGADGLVRVWDAATKAMLAELPLGDGESVRSVAWRPAGDGEPQLAIGSSGKEIRLWKPLAKDEAGRLETLAESENGVAALHWSADGTKLAVGELDAGDAIEVFDLANRARFSEHAPTGSDIYSIALDPAGRFVAAGSKHLTVTVFEIAGKRRAFSEPLHRGMVSALAWSPDGRRLASASHDGTIRITSPHDGKEARQIFTGHAGEINALIWAQLPGTNGGALFSGGADGTLRGWSAAASPESAFATRLGNWISGARWSPDGRRIAVTNFEDRIHLLDAATGAETGVFQTRGSLFDVEWSPAGDRLATASRHAGEIEVLDAETGKSLAAYPMKDVNRVAWSPSGKSLAAAGPAGVQVWDAQTGASLAEIARPTGSLVWSRDGRRLALGGEDGAIQIWDAFAGTMIAEWRAAPPPLSGAVISQHESPRQVFDLAWSPDGEWLAFVTQDCSAGLLETRRGRLVRTFTGHGGGIWRVAWSRDGRRLATCGKDGVLLVFNAQTGDHVAQLMRGAGTSELHAVDWSPDGRKILTGGYDLTARGWDAFRGHAIEAAEQLEHRVRLQPKDAAAWREVARVSAQLGWATRSRTASARAQELAPEDPAASAEAEEQETWFEHTLDTAPSP